MATSKGPMRRTRRMLTPEQKWEIWLDVTTGELTQADKARKRGVDISTVIEVRKLARQTCLDALASSRPGRHATIRDHELETRRQRAPHRAGQGAGGRADPGAGKIVTLGLSLGPVPAWVPGEVKEGLLGPIDGAASAGWSHQRARRARGLRYQGASPASAASRRRHAGDWAPGGNPVHRLLDWEVVAILELIEQWGPVDRSHRKLAHRGSYTGTVFVAPSTLRRVAEKHQVRLPEPTTRKALILPPWPDFVTWEPNSIWMWNVTKFPRARRVCLAIVDVVSQYWVELLVSQEESATQL